MPTSYSPNKNYQLQATGEDLNTWGINLNSNFSLIDNNLGGTLALDVSGNSDINLTLSQAQYLIHNLSGALTGDIEYIFPDAGGIYAINNQTTGNFTVTVSVSGGSGGVSVPQGNTVPIFVDATVPQVEALLGTQYNFVADTVGGTPNALTVSQTFPPNFTLNIGTFLIFTPTANNTASATIDVNGTGAKTIQKPTYAGLANLVAGDLVTGLPVLALYNGSVWIGINIIPVGYESTVSTNQSVGFGKNLTNYVNTASITYTIDQTTTMLSYWYVGINALGGSATITPHAGDVINVNGKVLAASASFVLPQGSSCQLTTDANGNLFINFTGALLNLEATISSGSTTDLGTMASHIGIITGTTTITSFGSAASSASPLYFIRFNDALTLTYNATSLIIPGGANITTAAGDTATVKYEGSGNWRVLNYTKASGLPVIANSIGGLYRNLSIITTSNTASTITASALTVEDSAGAVIKLSSVNVSYATGTSGANGVDTGSISNAWWYEYVIYNSSTATTASLISLSSTAPTMPSGYTFKMRVGAIYYDSGNKLRWKVQYGNEAQIVVGTNPTATVQIVSGTAGANTGSATPTWVSVAWAAYFPATAAKMKMLANIINGSVVIAAPNSNYSGYSQTTNLPPVAGLGGGTGGADPVFLFEIIPESSNFYWASSGASNAIFAFGWTDNI